MIDSCEFNLNLFSETFWVKFLKFEISQKTFATFRPKIRNIQERKNENITKNLTCFVMNNSLKNSEILNVFLKI